MPLGKRKTELVTSMDAFAEGLLEQARASESLADKIAAFEKIGKWIAIKNRLEDRDEDMGGASLADLKARIRGRSVHLTSEHQRAAALELTLLGLAGRAGDGQVPGCELFEVWCASSPSS